MITVIDLKISNLSSLTRALEYIGVRHRVSDNVTEIRQSDKLVLPGVGSFNAAVDRMRSKGIDEVLMKMVKQENTPILGICLGMQLFATLGEEGGEANGLDFIKGRVMHHRARLSGLRLPHIGWNEVDFKDMKFFESIENKSCFYFIHSYEFIPEEHVKTGYTNYGVDFVSVIQKGNVIGTQFHLEKSQKVGLRLLKNFCEGRF